MAYSANGLARNHTVLTYNPAPAAAHRPRAKASTGASLAVPPNGIFAAFAFTVEAVKLPPAAVSDSVGVVIGYQLEWSVIGGGGAAIASGASPLAFAEGDEIHFGYEAAVEVPLPAPSPTAGPSTAAGTVAAAASAPLLYPPGAFPRLVVGLVARLLDQSFAAAGGEDEGVDGLANNSRGASSSYSVGTLALDLGPHVPAHSALQLQMLANPHHLTMPSSDQLAAGHGNGSDSPFRRQRQLAAPPLRPLRQRATLYLERCIYQSPPAMIRVLVEGAVGLGAGVGVGQGFGGGPLTTADGVPIGSAEDYGAAANARLLAAGAPNASPSAAASAALRHRSASGGHQGSLHNSGYGGGNAEPHSAAESPSAAAAAGIPNAVALARQRAAHVRAKAREEAEAARTQQLTLGQRRAAAMASLANSATASRAHTPNTSALAAARQRGAQQQPSATPAASSIYAQRSNSSTHPQHQRGAPSPSVPPAPAPAEHCPVPLASPQHHQHHATPPRRPDGSTNSQLFASVPNHSNASAVPHHNNSQDTGSSAPHESIARDVLRALHRSNAALREDNDRLKAALEQRLGVSNANGGGGGGGAADRSPSFPAASIDYSLALSPQPHQQTGAASPSPSLGGIGLGHGGPDGASALRWGGAPSMGTTLSAVEELAALRIEMAATERRHNDALAAEKKDGALRVEALERRLSDRDVAEAALKAENARLAAELEAAKAALEKEKTSGAEAIAGLKKRLAASEREADDTADALQQARGALEEARRRGDEVAASLDEASEGRRAAEEKAVSVLSECTERVERYEASLRLGQQEMARLHGYGEELNAKCRELAALVQSQAAMLERRKEKILELRGIISANARHLPVGGEEAPGDDGLSPAGRGAAAVAASAASTATNFYTSGAGAAGGQRPSASVNNSAHVAATTSIPTADAHRPPADMMDGMGASSPLRELSRLLAAQQHQLKGPPQQPYQPQPAHSAPRYRDVNSSDYSLAVADALLASSPLHIREAAAGAGAGAATPQYQYQAYQQQMLLRQQQQQQHQQGGRGGSEGAGETHQFIYRQPYAKDGQFIGVTVPSPPHSARRSSPRHHSYSSGKSPSGQRAAPLPEDPDL